MDQYAILQDEPEALRARALRSRIPVHYATLMYLKQGGARFADGARKSIGPVLCFWPGGHRPRIELEAGARARLMGLSDPILLHAVGERRESTHLRMLVEKPFDIRLDDTATRARVETLFEWFNDDLTKADARMSLAACLRLLLMSALRNKAPEPLDKRNAQNEILRRFRHLVELHYRNHWKVTRYADELGVDYDRLNRTCRRVTGRNPTELIHERLTAEAKARLEISGVPLKQIAADLGFSDVTRFGHFFKRRTRISPGAYRMLAWRSDTDEQEKLERGFSDWP